MADIKKQNIIQYIPTKEVSLNECIDDSKAKELINKINSSSVTQEEKDFLIKAAQRHIVFNYKNIAEYYANASKEMQELMEDSCLVILDIDDAIEKGFAKLSDDIKNLMEE